MSTDKADPSKSDPKIAPASDKNKTDELPDEALERAAGGITPQHPHPTTQNIAVCPNPIEFP
jgi:hypothetical protein